MMSAIRSMGRRKSMKKQNIGWRTGWLLLFIVITCLGWSGLAYGADGYGVWVQGTKVTEKNATDVLGDGTVTYDAKKRH